MQTQTGHKRWTAFAAAAVAAGAIGCGDLTTDTAPGSSGEPSTVETKQGAVTAAPSRALDPRTRFFTPAPNPGAVQQVVDLAKARKLLDAARVTALAATPHAVWFTDGTPAEVKAAVRKTVKAAALLHTVPVLVAYNAPFRDCAQYSAGGAVDTAAYKAWIDGFAAGIGNDQVVVILEPDGLGIIPFNTTIFGSKEWCKPGISDANGNPILDENGEPVPQPGANPAERYAQINYAIDAIEAKAPSAAVYLDGTHSSWLGVSEAAYRLVQAGVQRAQGFFVNASNYQTSHDNVLFGTWVSDCITTATGGGASWAAGHFDWCPGQYDPATHYSTVNFSDAFAGGVNANFAGMLGGHPATTHFVIDTSRNGRGPLDATPFGAAPYNQAAGVVGALNAGNWCNPPGTGLGARPTANTGVPLQDANLWIKVPGESDGSCDSALGARAWDFTAYNPWGVATADQNHFDPLWGMVDPAAGTWFPRQALELAQLASPPLG